MPGQHNPRRPYAAVLLLCMLTLCAACNRGKTQPDAASAQSSAKRYHLRGKVISIDKQAGMANIDNEPISGFMDAMVMGYAIKPAAELNQLRPGDSITADIIVQGEDSWLENVTVVQHGSSPTAKPAANLRQRLAEREMT